ncbi:MAG: hypothetical protein ABGY09_04845 [Euryarchaeota archaeon]
MRLRALGSRGSGMVDALLLYAVMIATAAAMVTLTLQAVHQIGQAVTGEAATAASIASHRSVEMWSRYSQGLPP